jgi:hypothetical protein
MDIVTMEERKNLSNLRVLKNITYHKWNLW